MDGQTDHTSRGQGPIDEFGSSLTTGIARRLSRRGLFGLAGRGALALLGAGALAEGVLAQPAQAVSCGESITCDCFSGRGNHCPFTQGGSWQVCMTNGPCGCSLTNFADCCVTAGSCGCGTHSQCHSWGDGNCHCCYQGYCRSGYVVACRTYWCSNPHWCC